MDSPEDWRWIWLAIAGVCALGELAVPGTFFVLSFALGAVLAAVIAFLDGGLALQWIVFIATSVGALALLAPMARRLTQGDDDEAHEGAHRWVGRVGVVLEPIPSGPHATGRVRVERDEWRAESDTADEVAVGTEVEVVAVRGTRLVVVPASSDS